MTWGMSDSGSFLHKIEEKVISLIFAPQYTPYRRGFLQKRIVIRSRVCAMPLGSRHRPDAGAREQISIEQKISPARIPIAFCLLLAPKLRLGAQLRIRTTPLSLSKSPPIPTTELSKGAGTFPNGVFGNEGPEPTSYVLMGLSLLCAAGFGAFRKLARS
jgi:hypothetical protein